MLGGVQDQDRWLRDQLRTLGSGRRLDVGCGTGRHLDPGDAGVDLDHARLLAARERYRLVAVAEAHALPFPDGSFATVYAIRMLNDAGRIDLVLREIHRVLAPGGRLLVYTRARPAAGDRLDPDNGTARLATHFSVVRAIPDPEEPGGVLFLAER